MSFLPLGGGQSRAPSFLVAPPLFIPRSSSLMALPGALPMPLIALCPTFMNGLSDL